jgi:hypothetical protein
VHPSLPTTLEIEELYGRDRDVRGYLVEVDGKKVYLRTWQAAGAGPVHYFVQFPSTGKRQATVTFRSLSDAPFSLRRIWAFADFDRYFDANRLAIPYYLVPTIHLSFSDAVSDRQKLGRIKDSLGAHLHAKAAFTAFLPYASLNASEIERRIDYVLRLAEDAQMPVQLGFDTWWASTPSGSDGRGGYWSDVKYQQVVYNTAARRYQLSLPNRWSNTPWLTVNHPDLNAFKGRRLKESLAYLRRRAEERRARGKANVILAVNLDNEPVYWASGNAGLGTELLLADFNPAAVADARRDGVTLGPADGLDRRERLWLFRNLLRYNERIGRAAVQGLGRSAVLVTPERVSPPGDHLAANVYTQAMVGDSAVQYPMLDPAYPLWETAAPSAVRVGGEWNSDSVQEAQAVTHQIALGRNAAVNAETGNRAEKMRGVRVGYALAQRYYTLYNYPLDRMDTAASEIRDLTRPFPAFTFLPVLLHSDFRGDAWRKQAVVVEGVQTGLIGNTAGVAVYPASNERPGRLLYRLDTPRGGFARGPFLELTGRAFVSGAKDPNVYVRVLAGGSADPARMREVARFHDTGHFGAAERIDLTGGAGSAVGSLFVLIEMNAAGVPPEVLSWCSVRQVRFTAPWPAAATRGLEVPEPSLGLVRRRNLVVSWRRDAEIAIARLAGAVRAAGVGRGAAPPDTPEGRLTAAREAYARASYADAYRRASEGLGVVLPATYRVERGGRLAPFPVRVDSPAPVTCTLREWGRGRLRLALHGEKPGAVITVRITEGLTPGTRYALRQQDGEVILRKENAPAASGAALLRADRSGGLTFRLRAQGEAPQRAAPAATAAVRGVFLAAPARPPRSLPVISLLPEDGSNRIIITCDGLTRVTRGEADRPQSAADLADLRFGDQVEVRAGAGGAAALISASYRTVEGTVGAVGQMTAFAMPFIATREEGRPRVIDLSAPLHLPAGDRTFRASPSATQGLAPGDRVRLHVNPANGRVYGLWTGSQVP